MFLAYEGLSELFQEGESRYRSAKRRLDDSSKHRADAERAAKMIIGNATVILVIKDETDRIRDIVNEDLAEMKRLHQTGIVDTEHIFRLAEIIKGNCDRLEKVYDHIKRSIGDLCLKYESLRELARNASQSAYQERVKSQFEQLRDLDPEKQITDLLERYRKHGREVGDKGIKSYRDKLDDVEQTITSFLGRQDQLRLLTELKQRVQQFSEEINEYARDSSGRKLPVEGVQRLDAHPAFFQLDLNKVKAESRRLLEAIERSLGRLPVETLASEPGQEKLAGLQRDLTTHKDNVEAFEESIRQLNYRLRTIFSPLSLGHLQSTCDKLLRDFQFELQKKTQQSYRKETYKEAYELYETVTKYLQKVEDSLREINNLDEWFGDLEEELDRSRFEGSVVIDEILELSRQVEAHRDTLLQRFPKDIDKASEMLADIQHKRTQWIDARLDSLKSNAEKECEERLDEARGLVIRFDESLDSIRTQIHQALEGAIIQRRQGFYAQSLVVTRQAVDAMVAHLEEAQGSRAARIQLALLAKPNLGFADLAAAYEQRFKEAFDEEAEAELLRLLKEGKLYATFSV